MQKREKSLLKDILTESEDIESHEADELLEFIESLGQELTKKPVELRQEDQETRLQRIEKIKRTYYLKKDLITLLSLAENRCREIKNSRRDIKSIRITKSRIVNLALELLLNDFVENGEQSFLFQRLFSKHNMENSK